MKLIIENLFLVVLVAAVAVVGGVLVAFDLGIDEEIASEIAARKDVSDRLTFFASPGNWVNDKIVAAEANRVSMIVREANGIVREQKEKNRLPYAVLRLQVIEGGQVTGLCPAFPYDPNMYDRYLLTMQFIRVLGDDTESRLQALSPTRMPTDKEIEQELKIISSTRPAGEQAITEADKLRARDYAVFNRATVGRVYVDKAVPSEVAFAEGVNTADQVTLWRKQYKLWILTDLVAAIKATNDEVLSRVPEQERNVLNAPVKRWVWLRISDAYSSKGGEAAGGAPPPVPVEHAPYAPGPMYGGGPGPDRMTAPEPDDMRGGPRPYLPVVPVMPAPTPMAPAAPTAITPTAETLTKRYTDQELDVIQFQFQVVMPSRHVPLLMRKLTSERLCTVLGLKCEEVLKDPFYFYSNDPVVLATFTCEALFLVSWERDLVPPEFLKTIPADALREKDRQRLPK